jgi:hypothetical protein
MHMAIPNKYFCFHALWPTYFLFFLHSFAFLMRFKKFINYFIYFYYYWKTNFGQCSLFSLFLSDLYCISGSLDLGIAKQFVLQSCLMSRYT